MTGRAQQLKIRIVLVPERLVVEMVELKIAIRE
jgi:hypothetical protein